MVGRINCRKETKIYSIEGGDALVENYKMIEMKGLKERRSW